MTPALAAVAVSYLIGGIPFGLLLYRAVNGGDIRQVGSGNIGATNVARSAGWTIGVLTLALDVAKGAAAVLIGRAATGDPGWEAATALAAVAGHCFPIYLRFRGGKGVATGCGAFAVLQPAAMGAALAVFLAAILVSRMVSLASLLAALTFPAAAVVLRAGPGVVIGAAAAALVIVGRHHENIRRILTGSERRLGERREGGRT